MSDERIFRSPAQLKAELAQRHAELLTDAAFTRGVLANSSEAIMVLDTDARIAFASAGALRAIAVDDPAELAGTSWLALWRSDAQAQAAAAVADAKAGKTAVFEGARGNRNGKSGWWKSRSARSPAPTARPRGCSRSRATSPSASSPSSCSR